MRPTGATPDFVQDLIDEGPWLRRLAHSLLTRTDAAEDLAQDVVVEALACGQPPRGRFARRAWLRTVARRLAVRRSRQDQSRRRREEQCARPLRSSTDTRLELVHTLTHAVESLPEPYRTAIVLRYLDGLPPREIAHRFGISREAARQRVSRGLGMLRERLRSSALQDEQGSWALALLLGVPGWDRSLLSSATSTYLAISMTTSSKLLLSATLLACLLGGLWLGKPEELLRSREPSIAEQNLATATTLAVSEEETPRQSPEPSAEAPEPAKRIPGLVSVRSQEGNSIPGARVGWVDGDGRLRQLTLGTAGIGQRPSASSGAMFYAYVPGWNPGRMSSGALTEDVTFQLKPCPKLAVRVLVDGVPPRLSLPIDVATQGDVLRSLLPTAKPLDLERWAALGWPAPYESQKHWTEGGRLELSGLTEGASFALFPPSTHALGREHDFRYAADFPAGSDVPHVLHLLSLPMLRGTVRWEDGSPADGRLEVLLRRGGSIEAHPHEGVIDAEGSFRIGLRVAQRALLAPARERTRYLEDDLVQVRFRPDGGVPVESAWIDLRGAVPPIDVGILRAQRQPTIVVSVRDQAGEPIGGAALATPNSSARSDAEGGAELRASEGSWIRCLAPGYAVAEAAVSLSDGGERTLTLETGRSLEVQLPGAKPHWVELEWQEPLFEGAEDPLGFPRLLQIPLLSGVRAVQGEGRRRSVALGCPKEGPLLIHGLLPGAVLRVRALDHQREAWTEYVEVRTPTGPGRVVADLRSAPRTIQVSQLTLRIVDRDGEAIPSAHAFLGRSFQADSEGRITLAPLLPGNHHFSVRAPGFGKVDLETESLAQAPELERTITLESTRRITLFVQGEDGRLLAPDSLLLEDRAGEPQFVRHPKVTGVPLGSQSVGEITAEISLGGEV